MAKKDWQLHMSRHPAEELVLEASRCEGFVSSTLRMSQGNVGCATTISKILFK